MTAAITQRRHPTDCLCSCKSDGKKFTQCGAEWGPDISVFGRRVIYCCTRPPRHNGNHYSCGFGWWTKPTNPGVAEKINRGLRSAKKITKALARHVAQEENDV